MTRSNKGAYTEQRKGQEKVFRFVYFIFDRHILIYYRDFLIRYIGFPKKKKKPVVYYACNIIHATNLIKKKKKLVDNISVIYEYITVATGLLY